MENQERAIGKVSATEKNPSTTDEFYFWTDKDEVLSPFDIVKVKHLPGDETWTYGEVQEINHVTDAQSHFTSFISSDFGDKESSIGNMNRLGMNYVKAKVICNTDDIYMPVLDGKQVFLCTEDDISYALGLKGVRNPIVCGYLQMYKGKDALKIPVSLNENFLIGPEGAHLNVSGISGLAAKTSYSMFLLNALQQKYMKDGKNDVAFVFFNVKGRDLLAIDEANTELKDKDRQLYEDLGLEAKPFQNVRYFYPYADSTKKILSNADPADFKRQQAEKKAFVYKVPCDKYLPMLDLLLANEDDSTGTMESCVNYIINHQGNFSNVNTWETLMKTVENYAKSSANKSVDDKNNPISSLSWRKFYRLINKLVKTQGVFNDNINDGEKDLGSEIKDNLVGGQVMMIDITSLDENTQSFVFGSVIRSIWEMKFNTERDNVPKKVVIFVDELNKYASSDTPKNSPILHQLLDITERGRSLGIVLFSVEQFRSAINVRVKGNCATAAYGRTNAVEVSKEDYRYIPKVYQNMMTRLPAGEYIISNPALRSLVRVKFPYNTYRQFPNG